MRRHLIFYFAKNLSIVICLVLIWRGVWYLLDWLDLVLFSDNHLYTAFSGIILGLILLYLPDHDLKEIEKL